VYKTRFNKYELVFTKFLNDKALEFNLQINIPGEIEKLLPYIFLKSVVSFDHIFLPDGILLAGLFI